MQDLVRSSYRDRLTEAQVDVFFQRDQGLCGTKDLDGIHTRITTPALQTISKKNLQSRREIIGRSNFDVLEREDLAALYWKNDKKVMEEHYWVGVVPIFWEEHYRFSHVAILPIENKHSEIIGTYWQATIIEGELLSSFFEQLKRHKTQVLPESSTVFEVDFLSRSTILTQRESECLFFTLRGKTAKSIAKILSISPKTVEFHLDHLKSKFKVYSKPELISKAIEAGFLEKIPASILKLSNMLISMRIKN